MSPPLGNVSGDEAAATHRLVLLRHGQSVWNLEGRFTGWVDIDLTERGVEEARHAGRLLRELRIDVDVCHTSLLKRAIRTTWLALEEMERMWLPVLKTWRLNERHYGALQGFDRKEMGERVGKEQVFAWRRSYDVRPPDLADEQLRPFAEDPRYAALADGQLPRAESLKDTTERVLPYWNESVVPQLQSGLRVLISAHGNSLRALVKHLDRIPDEEIPNLEIPTGQPLIYELDEQLRPTRRFYARDQAGASAR